MESSLGVIDSPCQRTSPCQRHLPQPWWNPWYRVRRKGAVLIIHGKKNTINSKRFIFGGGGVFTGAHPEETDALQSWETALSINIGWPTNPINAEIFQPVIGNQRCSSSNNDILLVFHLHPLCSQDKRGGVFSARLHGELQSLQRH